MTPSPRNTPAGPVAGPAARAPTGRSYWVVEGRFLAGAYPYHADPARGRKLLEGLLGAGVTDFIDLTEAGIPGTADAHLLPYEQALEGRAVRYPRPVPDLSVPDPEHLVATLDLVDRLLGDGRSVYVHCWGGVGRTGTVVGCWMRRHDVAGPDDVLSVLTALRTQDRGAGHRPAPETAEQRRFVETWPTGR